MLEVIATVELKTYFKSPLLSPENKQVKENVI